MFINLNFWIKTYYFCFKTAFFALIGEFSGLGSKQANNFFYDKKSS